MKYKILFIFSLFLFSINFLSCIELKENVQLQPSEVNTTFIMEENFTFNVVEVYSTYIKLGNTTFSVNCSSGSINVTILNFTDTYKKWNETATNSATTVDHMISNLTASTSMLIKRNNVAWRGLTSNATGHISFNYAGGFSTITFELEAGTMPVTSDEAVSSGGSGGGYPIYKPTQEQMKEGYERSLRKNYKINFLFDNKTYSIKLNNLNEGIVSILILGGTEKIIFNLAINETKKINLNEDKYFDLEILLSALKNNNANLIVKLIHEEIFDEDIEGEKEIEKDSEQKQEDNKLNIKEKIKLGFLGLVIIILGMVIFILYKKRPIFKKNKLIKK